MLRIKEKQRIKAYILLSLILLLFTLTSASPALATTRIWTGKKDGSWLNKENWQGGTVPSPGDDLVFPADAINKVVKNDFPNGTPFRVIKIAGNYVIEGNTIVLTKKSDSNTMPQILASSGKIVFSNSIVLEDNGIIEVKDSLLIVDGKIELNGYELDLLVDKNGALIKQGKPISGKGNLTKNLSGTLYLKSPNEFIGWLQVVSGKVVIQHPKALKNATSIDLRSNTSLELEGGSEMLIIDVPLNFLGHFREAAPSLVNRRGENIWKGRINLLSDTMDLKKKGKLFPFIVKQGSTLVMEGKITGNGGIKKEGKGNLIFSGEEDNEYEGKTWVVEGGLILSSKSARAVPGDLIVGEEKGKPDTAAVLLARGNLEEQIDNSAVVSINKSGVLELNGHTETIRALRGDGHLGLAGNATLYLAPQTPSDMKNFTFTGRITGDGKIVTLPTIQSSPTPTLSPPSTTTHPNPSTTSITITPTTTTLPTQLPDQEYKKKIENLKTSIEKLKKRQLQLQKQVSKQERKISFLEKLINKILFLLKKIFPFLDKES